jgi:hypothetical protein
MVAAKADWAGASTAELVAEFVRSGLNVDRGLAEELLRRGAPVVPYLAQILDDDKYWRLDEMTLSGGWAPISALHLLGAIADPDGLEPILRVLHNRPDDLGDWLTEDVPSILASFGPVAVEPLKRLVSSPNLDLYVRVAGSIALSLIARGHPDWKDEVISFFHTILVREGEDKEFLSLCLDDVAELKDPRSKPILRSLFDSGMIDEEIIAWDDVEEIYHTPTEDLSHHNKQDPMTFFSPENLNYLRKINEKTKFEDEIRATTAWSELEEPEKKKVGRNDPCPCGSGKKYKKCCLPKTRGQRKVDEDEKDLRDAILEFAAADRFSHDWERALDMYKGGSEDIGFEGTVEEVMFMDWVIHDYPCVGSGEPIVTIFAKEKSSTLNERQRRILMEWQKTLFGVYEVIGVSKGEGIRLRDIITEEECFVEDVSVSNAAALWDIIVTRVIGVDGIFHISGAATILPQTRKRDLKDFLETGFMAYEEVHGGASFREFLRAESHRVIQYASQERTPIVTTTEGDEFYIARALYGLKNREATKRTLDKMGGLRLAGKNDGACVYNWLEAERSTDRRGKRHERRGFEEHRVLGVVTLTHDSLELECFSKERLSRLQDLLERKLKSSITFLADLSMDVETGLKQSRDRPREEKPTLSKDEEKRMMKEYLNHYYLEKWINTKIPALHNKTPLQSMKTEEAKASLTQLLNEMENLEERKRKAGEPYFDVDRLRSKLGLPIPRGATDEQTA